MPLNKPTIGQTGWGPTLNAALDYLDAKVANTADFTFVYDEADQESIMTVANHDMIIRTTRTANQDSDISITSADDVWITANDTVELTSNTDDVIIYTDANNNNYSWKFGQDGVISSNNNSLTIESLDADDVKGRLKFEPNNGRALLQAYSNNYTATFTDDWDTATWTTTSPGFSDLTLTNASTIISFMDNTGYGVDVLRISVNGGNYGIYNGASSGDGAITFNIQGITPGEGAFTLNQLQFQYAFSAKADIDFDEGQLVIRTENEMTTFIDSDDTLTLRSRTNQTRVQANGDVRFTANYGEDSQYEWKMRSNGRFEFPTQGHIESLFGNSSDGNNYDTFEIIPDFGLYDDGGNQHLVIEPTQAPNPEAPGHIHIRAGGTIDESTADLVLGGERNNVIVSDSERGVAITARPPRIVNSYANESVMSGTDFVTSSSSDIQVGYTVNIDGTDYVVDTITSIDEGVVAVTANGAVFQAESNYTFTFEPDYDNQWVFNADGLLIGPAMGALRVYALNNAASGVDLGVYSNDAKLYLQATDNVEVNSYNGNIFLNPDGGVFLGTTTDVGSQMAVQADLAYRRSGIVPTTSIGSPGDVIHQVVDDGTHHYYCTANYDGTTHIWRRVAWTDATWGV